MEKWGINVHFSNKHCNYYSAWVYVTKEDGSYLESPNHPDLTNEGPPWKLAASQTLVNCTHMREPGSDDEKSDGDSAEEGSSCWADKNWHHSRLTVFEVSEIAVGKDIKTHIELLALANGQKQEGRKDLAEFIFKQGTESCCRSTKWWSLTTGFREAGYLGWKS